MRTDHAFFPRPRPNLSSIRRCWPIVGSLLFAFSSGCEIPERPPSHEDAGHPGAQDASGDVPRSDAPSRDALDAAADGITTDVRLPEGRGSNAPAVTTA